MNCCRLVTCILVLLVASGSITRAGEAVGDRVREAMAGAVAEHPRLLVRGGDWAELRERVQRDPVVARLARLVIGQADDVVAGEPLRLEMRGRRMLRVSRDALGRLVSCSMAWHLTGERKYLEAATADLRTVAGFAHWNPAHFLDTAEMTMAVAVAYDWLHEWLDEETRTRARAALVEKGLEPALATERHWWMDAENNWNQVCHAGLSAGALAVIDHHPRVARRILERAVRHAPKALRSYEPAGAYPEGPSYWAYGTTYTTLMLAMFDSALGTRFGLDEASGFEATGGFPSLVTGSSGRMFNYGDGGSRRSFQPAVYWLAQRFEQPSWAAMEDRWLMERADGSLKRSRWLSAALLWRRPPVGERSPLPRHWVSRGQVSIAVHRESWGDDDGVFVGFKAGSPGVSHGRMDIGSFVMDAAGVRWAHHLKSDDYHHIESQGLELWEMDQGSDRWTVFRQTNLSHNTLVIDGRLQRVEAHAPIVRFSDGDPFPHSVADMSATYGNQARTVHRGIGLLPEGAVLVRDRLTGLKPGAEVRWGMVTMARIGQVGGREIELLQDGRRLLMTVEGDRNWRRIDLAEPRNEWDSPNPGAVMVAFTAVAPGDGEVNLAVVMRESSRERPELTALQLGSPLEWSAADD